MNVPMVRLTSLAHGGGCGCKLAPSVLQQLLADQPLVAPYRQLLVGTETPDDAAVWQLDDGTCVIATTDFFMPVVDDPLRLRPHRRDQRHLRRLCHGRQADHGAGDPRHPGRQDRAGDRARNPQRRHRGLRRCRHSGRWRTLHRLARADLRSCRHRHLQDRRRAPQIRRRAGRRHHPDQAARCRHLFGGDQEGRAVAFGLCGDDRDHDAAQPGRR